MPRTTTEVHHIVSLKSSLVLQESVYLALKNEPMSMPFPRVKRDCNTVSSTAYDLAAQDTTAPHGKSIQNGDQEGAQNNNSTCVYHCFPLSCGSRVPEGSTPELGVILHSYKCHNHRNISVCNMFLTNTGSFKRGS